MSTLDPPATKEGIEEYLENYSSAQEAMNGKPPDKEELDRVRGLVEDFIDDIGKKSKTIKLQIEETNDKD